MKTTFGIGIALVIGLLFFVLGGMDNALIGLLAFIIVAFQGYAGYYFEGRKSFPHALAGPMILGFFMFVASSGMQTLSFVSIMIWLVFTVYLGYKAEID